MAYQRFGRSVLTTRGSDEMQETMCLPAACIDRLGWLSLLVTCRSQVDQIFRFLPSPRCETRMNLAEFVKRTTCISCGGAELLELSSGKFSDGAVEAFIRNDPWGEHPAPFLESLPWAYVKCQSCFQAFHQYVLTPEWNDRRFNKWMTQESIAAFEQSMKSEQLWTATGYTSHILRLEFLTRKLRNGSPVRVLDFGCGYGQFLSMCSLFGFEGIGIDRSSAKRHHGAFPILAELDEVSGTFHAITLFEVLEHLDEPRPMLERLAGLLVPGGVLILETPNCEGIRGIETQNDYRRIHPLEHINGFTPASLQAFAEQIGFTRITPPAAFVTTSLGRVARSLAKQIVGRAGTQQYFTRNQDSQDIAAAKPGSRR